MLPLPPDEPESTSPIEEEASTVQALPPKALERWRKEIERARKVRESVAEKWDWEGNLDRYAPKDAKQGAGQVNIGADFADVERKKAALLFTAPDVTLTPDDPEQPVAEVGGQLPLPGQPPPPPPPTLGSLVLLHQELLNEVLGPRHIDIKGTLLKCLQNVLLVAGVGPIQVGYRSVTQQVDVPTLDTTGQPVVGPDGTPVTQSVPVPIHESYFAGHLSPASLLLPADFKDTDIRNAPWVGYDFVKPEAEVRSWLDLPDDVELQPSVGERPFVRKDDQPDGGGLDAEGMVSGVYIEYKSSLYGGAIHPEAIHRLVLLDGMETPAQHGPSPYQTIDQDGRLTPDSLRTFSILPLWIRDLTDSAWVPSDSTITGPLTREINKFRSQAIQQRDSAKQVILYDAEKITPDAKDKFARGEINTMIPVEPGALAQGAGAIMAQVATASLGRENYLGQDYIQNDRDKVLGIGANTQGAQTQSRRSATEVSTIQRNTEARFNQEQARVIEWYLSIVRAIDALILRFCDERMAVTYLGKRKGTLWAQFKDQLAGGYRHEVQVDSGKYLDAEAQRRQTLQLYQLTRQDPLINPRPVVKRLMTSWGIDPAEAIVEPQPATPPPPQASFSLRGDDLNPLNPQFLIAIKIAQQGGWQITPDDIEGAKAYAQQLIGLQQLIAPVAGTPGAPAPDTKHGGPAKQQMPISKRQEDETGGLPGALGGGIQ